MVGTGIGGIRFSQAELHGGVQHFPNEGLQTKLHREGRTAQDHPGNPESTWTGGSYVSEITPYTGAFAVVAAELVAVGLDAAGVDLLAAG